jgi:hypothetical protein
MKYFTPELIARGQSRDSAILNEVEGLWEEAGERYVAYLDTVRPHMPPGLTKIDQNYYLHDATIHGMGWQGNQFMVVLQLDTPPHSLLTFTYDLVEEPGIDRDALPSEARHRGAVTDWQYDEIEMVSGEPATWVQSILLNNGWQVRLHFREVRVQEVQALLPTPRNGDATLTSSLPQSA